MESNYPRKIGLFIIQWSDLTCHGPRIFFLSFFLPFPLRYLLYLRIELKYPRRVGFPLFIMQWFDSTCYDPRIFFLSFFLSFPFRYPSYSRIKPNYPRRVDLFIIDVKSLRRVTIQDRKFFFFSFFLSLSFCYPIRYSRIKSKYPRRVGFPFIYHATIWFDLSRSKLEIFFFSFLLPLCYSSYSRMESNYPRG